MRTFALEPFVSTKLLVKKIGNVTARFQTADCHGLKDRCCVINPTAALANYKLANRPLSLASR